MPPRRPRHDDEQRHRRVTLADVVNAASDTLRDVETGVLSAADVETRAVAQCRTLFGVVGACQVDPLWSLHLDVARQVLGARRADRQRDRRMAGGAEAAGGRGQPIGRSIAKVIKCDTATAAHLGQVSAGNMLIVITQKSPQKTFRRSTTATLFATIVG